MLIRCLPITLSLPRHARFQSTTSTTLRKLMRSISQPISIITVPLSENKQHGATISSLSSISLNPPLLSFSIKLPSRLVDGLKESGKGKIHLMGGKGEELAKQFARQFDKLPIVEAFEQLEGRAIGVLDCSLISVIELKEFGERIEEGGELGSELFIVRVEKAEINEQVLEKDGSLVYHNHSYQIVGKKE